MTNEAVKQGVVKSRPHYWVREDYDHLMGLLPLAHQDSKNSRSSSTSLIYPKNLEGAFRELRMRGLECDASTLMKLVEEKHIPRPNGDLSSLEWSKEDIDAAAEWLYENHRWSSWTHFCFVSNLSYGQCVKAYRVAAARFNLPFVLTFDLPGLVTVIEPAETMDDYAYVRLFPRGTQVEPQEDE